ncbi:MAG: sulfotransferase domain-containing protein [Bacteroidales bacterium]|nr:sulfotransferase domain-containing protein [Bacteroidales bacterium]
MLFNNKKILWIASYPKSGNTWIRILLSRILYNTSDINRLNIPIYSSKYILEEFVEYDISEYTISELHKIRLEVFKEKAEQSTKIYPVKIHDAFRIRYHNLPFLPLTHTYGAIYIVRNPFDLCISFSNHIGKTIDETIEIMSNSKYELARNIMKYQIQLPQKISSWSYNILSWITQKKIKTLIIRYEDLFMNTYKELNKIIKFINLNISNDKINDAIEFANFNNLQRLEKQYGFSEKSVYSKMFFNVGKLYYFRNVLTLHQIKKILKKNYSVIKLFNYDEIL